MCNVGRRCSCHGQKHKHQQVVFGFASVGSGVSKTAVRVAFEQNLLKSKMVTVDKCCCCFGLRTGVLILGWLGLISAILGIIAYVDALSHLEDYIPKTEEHREAFESAARSLVNAMIGESVIGILMNIGLLWGATKNSHLMLIPWLLMKGIAYVGTIIIIVIISIILFTTDVPQMGAILLFVGLIAMILPIYLWICVHSLYQRFKVEEQQKARRANEEIGFIPSAPVECSKPPAYSTLHNA